MKTMLREHKGKLIVFVPDNSASYGNKFSLVGHVVLAPAFDAYFAMGGCIHHIL